MEKNKQTSLKVQKSNFRCYGYTLQDLKNNLINGNDISTTLRCVQYILTEADLSNNTKIGFVYKIDLDIKNYLLRSKDVDIRKATLKIFKILLENFEYQKQIDLKKTLSYILQVKKFDKSVVLKKDADVLYNQFISSSERKSDIAAQKNEAKADIEEFERQLHKFLIEKLKERYGDKWWDQGVPTISRENAYKKQNNRLKEDPKCNFKVWEFLDFSDYIGIIGYGKNWHKIFKDFFPDKNRIIYTLKRLRQFRNDLYHIHLNEDDLSIYKIFLKDISIYFSK